MMTHSIGPVSGVPNARAIDGRPMFTIEESSVVMNIPTQTNAITARPRAVDGATLAIGAVTIDAAVLLSARYAISSPRLDETQPAISCPLPQCTSRYGARYGGRVATA